MNTLAIDILTQLRQAGKYGHSLTDLANRLRAGSHRTLGEPALEIALRDLDDCTYVARFTAPLSGARWRITAMGESALQEAGL